ncbi:CLUMA_CG019277, isoform A [Clunio marinus]|uniref:CLUMA_CG019277, isoform A n=1 Tax=Clunio marinus TaxID=568069 RepID=A0A1J1J5S4_9DIPT|nr:CLUMA_CG019277, isoform A [Clunio marinus]
MQTRQTKLNAHENEREYEMPSVRFSIIFLMSFIVIDSDTHQLDAIIQHEIDVPQFNTEYLN